MANFRNFTLYNKDKSESVGLNDFDGYMVNTPSGLGIYLSNSYLNVGSKRILTGQNIAFKPLTMNIGIFAKTRTDVEKKYGNLRNFLARNRKGGFLLSYVPYAGAQERYIECDIKDFDKTEKKTSNYMLVPVTVEPRTFWRVDEETRSTAQDEDIETNEFIFGEDTNISGVEEYDFIAANQTGEQEFDIYGYDKGVLPQGVSLDCVVNNISDVPDVFYNSPYYFNLSLDDFKLEDGKLVCEKVFWSSFPSSTRKDNWCFCVSFDPVLQNAKAVCKLYFSDYYNAPAGLYNITVMDGIDFSLIKIDFDDSLVDEDCKGTIYYITKFGGFSTSESFVKPRGEKTIYVKINGFLRFDPNTPNEIKRPITQQQLTYGGRVVADMFQWSVDGALYKGLSNYLAAFLYDAETYDYNIAMFTGAISKNTLTNDGDTESPLKIRISGAATNPTISITPRGGGTPLQTCKINYTISAGAYFEIDSDPENTGAWIISANGTRYNAIALLDQTTNMFLTLPVGEYDIRIVNDNNEPVVATVYFKKEYLGA